MAGCRSRWCRGWMWVLVGSWVLLNSLNLTSDNTHFSQRKVLGRGEKFRIRREKMQKRAGIGLKGRRKRRRSKIHRFAHAHEDGILAQAYAQLDDDPNQGLSWQDAINPPKDPEPPPLKRALREIQPKPQNDLLTTPPTINDRELRRRNVTLKDFFKGFKVGGVTYKRILRNIKWAVIFEGDGRVCHLILAIARFYDFEHGYDSIIARAIREKKLKELLRPKLEMEFRWYFKNGFISLPTEERKRARKALLEDHTRLIQKAKSRGKIGSEDGKGGTHAHKKQQNSNSHRPSTSAMDSDAINSDSTMGSDALNSDSTMGSDAIHSDSTMGSEAVDGDRDSENNDSDT
ncbi:hypothetical protein AAMO2058_000943400 [Amorphochlora amoebiformis]